jgi:protein-tyrosine phosphatase
MGAARILFVCTGNLCRSPMAHAVGQNLARGAGLAVRLDFDSAGTQALQGRASTDPRARAVLTRAGYVFEPHRARRVTPQDLVLNDLVLAMDAGHLDVLRETCEPEHAHKLRLFLDFAPGLEGRDVPDPYFGDLSGFDRVLTLCEAGIRGLLHAAPGLFANGGRDDLRALSAG